MKVLNIIPDSIVDGVGLRTTIFFAGCPHRCDGCHNPQSWNHENGTDISIEELFQEIQANELNEVTLSGGEPFLQAEELSLLAERIKTLGKDIWCYTGFTFETLLAHPLYAKCLPFIDVLVDGRFELSQRDLTLWFKGSRNQRVIDVSKSLSNKMVILYEKPTYNLWT